jgi:hypothetical protein
MPAHCTPAHRAPACIHARMMGRCLPPSPLPLSTPAPACPSPAVPCPSPAVPCRAPAPAESLGSLPLSRAPATRHARFTKDSGDLQGFSIRPRSDPARPDASTPGICLESRNVPICRAFPPSFPATDADLRLSTDAESVVSTDTESVVSTDARASWLATVQPAPKADGPAVLG